jgi:hypothetical protein
MFFYFLFFSTGSYHHLFQGMHLIILHIPFIEPLNAHFFSTDSIIYSLQEGICIQYGVLFFAQKE